MFFFFILLSYSSVLVAFLRMLWSGCISISFPQSYVTAAAAQYTFPITCASVCPSVLTKSSSMIISALVIFFSFGICFDFWESWPDVRCKFCHRSSVFGFHLFCLFPLSSPCSVILPGYPDGSRGSISCAIGVFVSLHVSARCLASPTTSFLIILRASSV